MQYFFTRPLYHFAFWDLSSYSMEIQRLARPERVGLFDMCAAGLVLRVHDTEPTLATCTVTAANIVPENRPTVSAMPTLPDQVSAQLLLDTHGIGDQL